MFACIPIKKDMPQEIKAEASVSSESEGYSTPDEEIYIPPFIKPKVNAKPQGYKSLRPHQVDTDESILASTAYASEAINEAKEIIDKYGFDADILNDHGHRKMLIKRIRALKILNKPTYYWLTQPKPFTELINGKLYDTDESIAFE
jgi:hypothetical protein